MDICHERLLITGVAGFIGSALALYLIENSNFIITGIDNMNDYYDVRLEKYRLQRIKESTNTERFVFKQGDIADKAFVDNIFAVYKPTYVINLAAQAGVRYSIDNPDVYIRSNVVGFYNILENCRKNDVKHLLFASSSSVYGNNKKIPYSTEDMTDRPVSLYAATK